MNHETLNYKGYTASIKWDAENDCFDGEVVNLDSTEHVITFEGGTFHEIREAFIRMIDWYLLECGNDGVEPSKPIAEIVAHSV
jgi:predicted HicB family RNase H-like nuclease